MALGADHAGRWLKDSIKPLLDRLGIAWRDYGTSADASVDYPDFAEAVARAVADGTCAQGILVCGTGIGMAMAANKVRGVRAAVCHDSFTARMSRAHNDANVLCLGARVVGSGVAEEAVRTFLETPFEGGRHAARLEKISRIEKGRVE